MGNGMDATRGIMSGTMDRFKKVHVGEYGVNWNMEFNILALFSHQDELCFRNSNTLCLYVCMFFLCIKLHIESMFMY
ncbi:hypothetical protein ERO13_A02G048600v2 [Gossypium hirsutum]|nr:hypothetical protein ERO13_A02G048600v2 [Gossypium hirsutum]